MSDKREPERPRVIYACENCQKLDAEIRTLTEQVRLMDKIAWEALNRGKPFMPVLQEIRAIAAPIALSKKGGE